MLADIPGLGWTTPSGRVEPGEDPAEAAKRECLEETGSVVESLRELGHYRLSREGCSRLALVYVTEARELVDVPGGSESRGRQVVAPEGLPLVYSGWNALFERVFAEAARFRSAPPGTTG